MWIQLLAVVLACIIATSTANAQAIRNAIPDVARPLPLHSVRVTGGPLKASAGSERGVSPQARTGSNDGVLPQACRPGTKSTGYPGWDGDGKNLTGHIAGHYLSGVSLMFAATGDPRFKEKADYIVREMKEVQDKNGDVISAQLKDSERSLRKSAKETSSRRFFDLERPLVSLVYACTKPMPGLTRCLSFYRQSHGAGDRVSSLPHGPKVIMSKLTPNKLSRCSIQSLVA